MDFVLIGAGSAGKRHLKNLIAMKQTVKAIADPRFERQEKDGIQVYSDPEECLWEQANSRAVVISSPSQFHKPQFTTAVDSGAFAILVEKPIAITKEDASKMVYSSENLGVRAAVGNNWRYHDAFQSLMTSYYRNPLNMFSVLSSDNIRTWPAYRKDGCYMLDENYGGVGLTTAVHSIDMCVKLNGPALGVLGNMVGEWTDLDQSSWIRIYHANGAQSMILAKWATNQFFALSMINPAGGHASDMHAEEHKGTLAMMHYNLLKDFLKFAETGKRPKLLCDPREAYEGLVILYAAMQSFETNSLVEIERVEE